MIAVVTFLVLAVTSLVLVETSLKGTARTVTVVVGCIDQLTVASSRAARFAACIAAAAAAAVEAVAGQQLMNIAVKYFGSGLQRMVELVVPGYQNMAAQ